MRRAGRRPDRWGRDGERVAGVERTLVGGECLYRGVLVGGRTSGASGGEMLSMLGVAIAGGVPTERLRHMIYAYPTFHRGVEGAPLALLQAFAPAASAEGPGRTMR
jgi:pyruvate/2-oxoglutarate dehydrogenase complex dihydrolipoamide dehydrogenase (E3) component